MGVQRASLSAGSQRVPKKPTVGVVGANQTLRTSASHQVDGGEPSSRIDFVTHVKRRLGRGRIECTEREKMPQLRAEGDERRATGAEWEQGDRERREEK